jgi:SAM-dependent methyltransferase
MGQVVTGLRAVLTSAAAYNVFQHLMGADRGRREFVRCYVRPKSGQWVLDIGCGTADLLAYLPDVHYYGFDSSQKYIDAARQRFGSRAVLACTRVSESALEGIPKVDLALAIGVVHHLGNDEAVNLFQLANSALKRGGRLVTLDCCFVPGQSRIARFLIAHDRGQNVRDEQGYKSLAEGVFPTVKTYIRHDMARFPYTHLIMECIA